MHDASIQSDPEFIRLTRPRQATTLAVLLLVFGGLGILVALLLMSIIRDSTDHGQSVPAATYILTHVQFGLSASLAMCGVFVWQGRSWGRVLAVVLCSVNLISALVTVFTGQIAQAAMGVVINIALLRLLNNYDVQVWCSR